jgi:hypothetical protein
LILFRVQTIRNLLEARRINAVHYFKHKTYRTAVDLFRPSTPCFGEAWQERRGRPGIRAFTPIFDGLCPGTTESNLNAYACHRSSALAAESTRAMTATARGRGEMVDATDLSQNLSAPAETRDAELLKVGETFDMAIPSQALWPKGWSEGVETRRAAPKAKRARVKG